MHRVLHAPYMSVYTMPTDVYAYVCTHACAYVCTHALTSGRTQAVFNAGKISIPLAIYTIISIPLAIYNIISIPLARTRVAHALRACAGPQRARAQRTLHICAGSPSTSRTRNARPDCPQHSAFARNAFFTCAAHRRRVARGPSSMRGWYSACAHVHCC